MRIHHPHLYSLSLKVLRQLIFLFVLLTSLTEAQEADSKKVTNLIDQLKHSDSVKRQNAAQTLMRLREGAKVGVPQLIEALNDPDAGVRKSAADVLGNIGAGAEEAIPDLIAALKDPDKEVRDSAATSLWQIGEAAAPLLSKALKDPRVVVRRNVAIALGYMGGGAKEAVPQLTEALNDSDVGVRSAAAIALGNIGEGAEEAVPHLSNTLKDPDKSVRLSAAIALAHIGEGAKVGVPQLTEALNDPEKSVRVAAAETLDQLSTILAREKVTESSAQLKTAADTMRNSSDPEVKQYADRVQQASDLLKLLWWEQLKRRVITDPTISFAVAVYLLLLLVWLALLWVRPLWLLHINEALAKTTDIKLPEKLGGFNVAPRYLILVGFFHYRPRILDAWVAKHVTSARKMFSSLQTAKEREIYVPLPLLLGAQPEADLSPDKLRPVFSHSLICLQIWGEGGSGKTSLACMLAKWAMASRKEDRLNAEHLMLPVLVEQDLPVLDKDLEHPLFRAIRQQIRVMINEDDHPPAGLLRQLLKKRRVLVIVDGFSEMNEASRAATLAGITDLPVNAVIITTRADEQLGVIPKAEIKPLRVKGNRLATFMEAYLTARKKRDLFDDEEYFEACRRLSQIVGDRDITALLAKLYAEQMIAAKEGSGDADAPQNIPELMLSYLNDLCRGAGPGDPDIRVVHRAAKAIAWECLRRTLRPTPADRRDVLGALGGEADGLPLIRYFEESLRVIQTVGAGRDRIRFALDPLAEYLAGMHLVEENGEDEESWRSFLARVDEQGGLPEDVKGFLLAIRDCCLAKGEGVQGLKTVADELAQRAGINQEESNRYKTERRVKQLIPRLKYSEAKDRMHAAEELGSIGVPANIAVKDLCMLLRDPDESVRRSAAEALRGIGEGSVPQLIEALKDPDAGVRMNATDVLKNIGEGAKGAVPQLIQVLKDTDPDVRFNACLALGHIGEGAREAVPQLIEALKDPDSAIRRIAASALSVIEEKTKKVGS